MTTIWDYDKLLTLAKTIESTVANLGSVADLQATYRAGTLDADLHTRKAWAEVGPEAARRALGDCQPVNELAAAAVLDLQDIERMD